MGAKEAITARFSFFVSVQPKHSKKCRRGQKIFFRPLQIIHQKPK
jgi:hypothetical protein